MNSAPSEDGGEAIAGTSRADNSSPEKHTAEESSCESSSSGNVEEGPPRKKQKKHQNASDDPRFAELFNQVSLLTNIIMHQQYASRENAASVSDFLINPASIPESLNLGECRTNFEENRVRKPANAKRLQQLIKLQHFKSSTWPHIRYKKALIDMLAAPGFCNLKINNELYCLNKGRDFLAPTEEIMAAITNGMLHQRELLQSGLQEIIDWAHNNRDELRCENLFNKFTSTFGSDSSSYKLSEQLLQIICGKRAECIEMRRKRLIDGIQDKNIQAALHNIPPCEEFLFEKTELGAFIQSLGGPQFWLSSSRIQRNKENHYKTREAPSTSSYKSNMQNNRYNFHNKHIVFISNAVCFPEAYNMTVLHYNKTDIMCRENIQHCQKFFLVKTMSSANDAGSVVLAGE
ncbi:hypothetical protein RR48_03954 [Papilio machaon]|uniref:Uncharacterized protein n=1 Tax=Papilio machaon TaxID=76193 RepID=A0A0N1IK06_PAPMA|nr:hypothetical protein RR48_03954 [Papilio machaon]